MKKLIFASLICAFVPYFVGLENNRNAIIVCQNFTDRTDEEIEDVLRVYNLENDCISSPTFAQLYKSGLKTIVNPKN